MNKFVDVTKIMINNGNLNPIIPELISEYIKIDETGIIKIYNDVRYRHVDKILLLGKNNFIRCYKRK